ncbi:hypothetical protein ABBQ32_007152 [Trebouxia sp. C0010 RCD-2024]
MFRRSHTREQYSISSSPSKHKAKNQRKARTLINRMHKRWQPCVRCALWALLAACIICFCCITFVRPTGWYRDDTGGHFGVVWEALQLELPSQANENASKPIMAGMVGTQVLLQWGTTLTTALSVIALKSIQQQSPAPRPSPAWHRLTLQARRLGCTPLPPARLWRWLCGSMNLLDAVIVLLWISLQLTWAHITGPLKQLGCCSGWRNDQLIQHRRLLSAFGWAASTDLLLLFYPVPRNTFLHWLFNTDFPGLVKYHRWLGNGLMVMVTIHATLYYSYWLATSQWLEQTFHWNHQGVNRLAGSLAWLSGLALTLTATQYVRRRWYSVFYITHILGFFTLMTFAFIHYQSMWAYTLPGFVLYLMDVSFRIAQQMHRAPVSPDSKVSQDGTLATLSLPWHHAAELVPSQILWINIPSLSQLHWHPVSIAHVDLDDPQNPASDGSVTVHFKAYGAWTKGLIGKLSKGNLPLVKASGPFGCPQGPKWAAHQVLVIFAGGIGITPMLGMLRHMAAHARANKADPRTAVGIPDKVYLIWSSRSHSELQLLDQDLLDLARQDEAWLSIQLHCTSNQTLLFSSAQTLAAEPSPARVDEGAGLLTEQLSSSEPSHPPEPTPPGYPTASGHGKNGCLLSCQLADASQKRPLVSYGFGNLHWAAAHVASMAGAFCAGIAVYSFRAANDEIPGWSDFCCFGPLV